MSPFLAWGDFHARSRFARSTIPEEKWGTTSSLARLAALANGQDGPRRRKRAGNEIDLYKKGRNFTCSKYYHYLFNT